MGGYKWLVFDMGGVLANYIGPGRLMAWMRRPVEDGEFHRLWLFSPAVRAFESGRIGPGEFAERVIGELDLDVRPDAFLAEYPDFLPGWFAGAEELLAALAPRYSLALLSNTNVLHWGRITRQPGCQRLFDRIFLSCETGFLKPDGDAFRHAVATLGCPAEEIAFFDDNSSNVRGAKDCGLAAFQVADLEDLKAKLAKLGILS